MKKKLEKSGKSQGILSEEKSGNPEIMNPPPHPPDAAPAHLLALSTIS